MSAALRKQVQTFRGTLVVLMFQICGVLMGHAYALETLGLPTTSLNRSSRESVEVALGKKLFFDRNLSRDRTISCASCHIPKKAFTDSKPLAKGIEGQVGLRNTPSLINSAFNTTQFWDGRRTTLESQALDPLINPREQGMQNYPALLDRIREKSDYVAEFGLVFQVTGRHISKEQVGLAIAAFERSLLAGNSAFDRYFYGGEKTALTPGQMRGLALFRGRAHCDACHSIGDDYALFTDRAFHSSNVGLNRISSSLADLTRQLVEKRQGAGNQCNPSCNEADLAELGRFAVTLNPIDIGRFKTPSLRNVALTAPYMHDGSVADLKSAVELESYSRGTDIGRPLLITPLEQGDLVQFLEALTSPAEFRAPDAN